MTATAADLRRLQRDNQTLVNLALADIRQLVRTANTQAVDALYVVLPQVIETYGIAAATLAADWYDDLRESAPARRRFTATPADLGDQGAQALVGWAVFTATDDAAFEALLGGGTQRRIVNFSRGTVMTSSVADPEAEGWQRATDGNACGFCQMLASRGAVYRSEDTATFGAHDACGCTACPAFGGEPLPVEPFTPSSRDIPASDQRRARDWMRANHLV